MPIVTHAYPRAALVGNPSDGYFGKTIALFFSNYRDEVTLTELSTLELIPNNRDKLVFASIVQLIEDVCNYGYYGGIRLLKASVKRWFYVKYRG